MSLEVARVAREAPAPLALPPLPNAVVQLALAYLPLNALLQGRRVSRAFCRACSANELWRPLYIRLTHDLSPHSSFIMQYAKVQSQTRAVEAILSRRDLYDEPTSDAEVEALASQHPNTTSFKLQECELQDGQQNFSDAALVSINTHCQRLNSFSLGSRVRGGLDHISSAALLAFLSRYPGLRELSLVRCTQLEGADFATILTRLTNIRSLELASNELNGAALSAALALPQLTHLKLQGSCLVNDAFLERVTTKGTFSTLHIRLTDHQFSPESIKNLLGSLHGVQSFSFRECHEVTADDLLQFSRNNPDLMEIELDNCAAIDSDALEQLKRNCPKLQSLKLEGCIAALQTDMSLLQIN